MSKFYTKFTAFTAKLSRVKYNKFIAEVKRP